MPEKKKISLKTQLKAVAQNKPYLIAVAGQFLFGVTLYGRNADALYYFTYVEGNQALFSTYSYVLLFRRLSGQPVFRHCLSLQIIKDARHLYLHYLPA